MPTCFFLSLSQLFMIFFYFSKKERVILVPPVMKQPVWIDGFSVSKTYLEQMGLFLGHMLLSNSATSVAAQRETLLRYVHPKAYTHIRQYLIEEEEHLKKHGGSYHFHIRQVFVDMGKGEVILNGDRESYIAGRRIDSDRESYKLTFHCSHGRYLLVGCEKIKLV